MEKLLLFFLLFSISGCSFKTTVHPYPKQFTGNPDYAVDSFEIHRMNDFLYVNTTTGTKLPFNYTDGALHIKSGMFRSSTWIKNDTFTNPITGKEYVISAYAAYDKETNSDEFELFLNELEVDSSIAFIEGFIDDAIIYLGDNSFRLTVLDYWDPVIEKVKEVNGTVWHHYPFGGSWSLEINDIIIGEIIQGSPVIKQLGKETNYGTSYTFFLLKQIDPSLKADLLNITLSYLALSDMEFYYSECDLNDDYDQDCPGSIIIN